MAGGGPGWFCKFQPGLEFRVGLRISCDVYAQN